MGQAGDAFYTSANVMFSACNNTLSMTRHTKIKTHVFSAATQEFEDQTHILNS